MEDLFIYNTLSRQKEKFIPVKTGHVSLYVCGPTVYGHSHIGHAKSYVSFDCVVRWFKLLGYDVKYVQNITDVGHLTDDADLGDDKVAKKAKEENLDPMEIAQFYTRSFYEDMDALSVLRPNIAPTATGHIPEQIDMIAELIKKGYAYESNGNVYFSVSSFPSYGKLSGITNQDELETGHRVEATKDKRHPSDFALWKKAEESHLMKWSSPWGVGYPGWHIECSAMSMKYLGNTFDIHGGGLENRFPHHECEIAQSEALTGKRFANYWMHNNMVTVGGVKMGKSLGNFTTIKDLLKTHSPATLRFFILQSHYRSVLDFSHDAIHAAELGLQKLIDTFARLKQATTDNNSNHAQSSLDIASYIEAFHKAMNDDFNTAIAIATLFDFARYINSLLDKQSLSETDKALTIDFFDTYANKVIGILDNTTSQNSDDDEALTKVMDLVVALRDKARNQKDFAMSDFIRDKLIEAHIQIQDGKNGTSWKKIL